MTAALDIGKCDHFQTATPVTLRRQMCNVRQNLCNQSARFVSTLLCRTVTDGVVSITLHL